MTKLRPNFRKSRKNTYKCIQMWDFPTSHYRSFFWGFAGSWCGLSPILRSRAPRLPVHPVSFHTAPDFDPVHTRCRWEQQSTSAFHGVLSLPLPSARAEPLVGKNQWEWNPQCMLRRGWDSSFSSALHLWLCSPAPMFRRLRRRWRSQLRLTRRRRVRPCAGHAGAGPTPAIHEKTQNWVVTSRAGPAADGIDSYTLV